MTIRSLARPIEQVVTAPRGTPVREVTRFMEELAVGSVVVYQDEPVGIVTERDLTLRGISRDVPLDASVREEMGRDLVTIHVDAGAADARRKMKRNKVRRLSVVDGDSLVGFLSADDLLVLLEQELDCLAEVIRYESSPH